MNHAARSESRVTRAARQLGEFSLACEEGDFLGAEDELLVRLGVSRPTLRQAAKIAENDRLISVRRGIRGGFYAARPDADDAIRTLARYLRLRGAQLADLMQVSRLVAEEAAMQACRSTDMALRAQLAELAVKIDAQDTPDGIIRVETELAQVVSAMSGNPAIELVMAIGYTFGMEERRIVLFRDPAHRQIIRRLERDLCRAVLDRDEDIARLIMRRRAETISRWITEAGGAVA
jgi:GntR family transcriptional regulator, transcriptional repressor for pyruvate dehydrogenase complex